MRCSAWSSPAWASVWAALLACVSSSACASSSGGDGTLTDASSGVSTSTTTGDGDTQGDGDGDTQGDGDGDTQGDGDGDTQGDGDGDGDTQGDGDGDTQGDGDTGEPGASLGVFDLTYYWVSYEGDFDPGPTTDIGTCQGQVIASVRSGFANALKLEGSGKLLDDRIVNIGGCGCGGGYDCFAELDPVQFPWGQGSQGNALAPYVSIATDTSVLPFGTAVYVPALDGQSLPDGSTHDGCLSAADVGGGINGMHFDWFVGIKDNYLTLDPDVPETVELFEAGSACP